VCAPHSAEQHTSERTGAAQQKQTIKTSLGSLQATQTTLGTRNPHSHASATAVITPPSPHQLQRPPHAAPCHAAASSSHCRPLPPPHSQPLLRLPLLLLFLLLLRLPLRLLLLLPAVALTIRQAAPILIPIIPIPIITRLLRCQVLRYQLLG